MPEYLNINIRRKCQRLLIRRRIQMRKYLWCNRIHLSIWGMAFILAWFFMAGGILAGYDREKTQESEQERIVEQVTVTNVEVPVRVLLKKEPVKDLKKEDFTLYEDKTEMEINGFYPVRKTIQISPSGDVQTDTAGGVTTPVPRTFVLVFNLTSFNEYFQEAIGYLFDTVLRADDRVLVFANNTTLEYGNLHVKEKVKEEILASLKKESHDARVRLIEYITRIETYLKVDDFRVKLHKMDDEQPERLIDFIKRYLLSWDEYKTRYLTPPLDRFYYFARFLEKVKGEKWVLNFYQFELFPKIRLGSDTFMKMREISTNLSNTNNATLVAQGRKLDTLVNQLESDLSLQKNFPNDEISKLFYKVDATFHSFFIPTSIPSIMQDFDYRSISSDLEAVLKSITDITGGKNITTTNLAKAIRTVSEVEDIYYILTYVPKDAKKVGQIKVKVNNKKYEVLYDNNFRADYISEYLQKLDLNLKTPDIAVENFSFKDKTLSFSVVDFLMKKLENAPAPVGQIRVRIRLMDEEGNAVFDQSKVLTAQKKDFVISLPTFKEIKKGEYSFLIDVRDMFTGKEDNYHHNVTVK